VTGIWASATDGMLLAFLDGNNSETVRVTALPGGNKITGCFWRNHAVNAPVRALGGFATGIIPPSGVANPSTATVLKLHGDINGDGNMMYVEYTCDTTSHNLYRNAMPFDTTFANKPTLNDSKVLLSNVLPNPGGIDCFNYQTSTPIVVGATTYTFVLDVAITLTVETQEIDPITKVKQTETKALLNVSPRNVYHAWSFAGMAYNDRVQATPPSVTALLAPSVTP